jgi:hypothetical protein
MTYPCDNCIYQTSGGTCHYADKAWVDTDGTKRNYPGCKKWRLWWGERWTEVRILFGAVDSMELLRQQAEHEDWGTD